MLVAAAFLLAGTQRLEAGDVVDPVPRDECAASIRSAPSFVWRGASGRGYDESAPSMWQDGIIRVEVLQGICTYALVVDTVAVSLSGPSGSINAMLSDAPGGADLASLSRDPFSSPFVGSGVSGDMDEFPVFLSLPRGQALRAGDYAGSVPLRLFVLGDGLPVQVDEAMIDLSASIGARLSVSAPGFSGGTADVDLGDISQGFERHFAFEVLGNTPVSVSFVSMNSGTLRHEEANMSVPYRTMFEGVPVDLRSGPAASRFELDPAREQNLDLVVSGDRIERPVAGVYRDVLTITFRSDG